MEILLAALLGAVMNRIRGSAGVEGSDWIYGGGYALFLFLLGGDPLQSACAGLAVALAVKPGWGRYIGFMGGINGNWDTHKPQEEVAAIDWIIQKLKPNPRLWGYAGLMLRGLIISCAMAIGAGWHMLPMGLWMAAAYYHGISGEQVFLKRNGFTWGEYAFGGWLWGMTAILFQVQG